MRSGTLTRERGHWRRSLVLVGLLALGTACGNGGTAQPGDDGPGTPTERVAETRPNSSQNQQGSPRPLGETPTADDIFGRSPRAGASAPPGPDLGTQHPVAPPNTVSLEELHRQGRTHVLR